MLFELINTIFLYYTENPFAQSVWIIALITIIYGYIQKDDDKLKLFSWIWIGILWIHFLMLWFYIAAMVNFVAIFRNIISIRFIKSDKLVILFSIIYISIFLITFESVYDIYLIIWWLMVNFAYFKLRWITLKSIIMWNSIIWLIFNIHSESIWWMITSISIILTLIIPIISLYISKVNLKNRLELVPIKQEK